MTSKGPSKYLPQYNASDFSGIKKLRDGKPHAIKIKNSSIQIFALFNGHDWYVTRDRGILTGDTINVAICEKHEFELLYNATQISLDKVVLELESSPRLNYIHSSIVKEMNKLDDQTCNGKSQMKVPRSKLS